MPALTITSDELRSGVDIIAAAAAEVLGAPAISDTAQSGTAQSGTGQSGTGQDGNRPRGEEDK
jgi:diaminobutyrate-2-oxoglutarate transaminase